MVFKKCDRCGCFFTDTSDTCCNCSKKDAKDIAKLKMYFEEASVSSSSIDSISLDTGITLKNLNRFLKDKSIESYVDADSINNNSDFGNISINL